jgi:hypothetical protein
MVDRVSHEVFQRSIELLQDVAVHHGRLSLDLKLDLLAELPGKVADQSRQPLHSVAKRPHPAGDHFAIQTGAQVVRVPHPAVEFPQAFRKQLAARSQPLASIAQQVGAPLLRCLGLDRFL